MTQREEFEAWYVKTYPFSSTMPGKFDREGGDYTDTTVNVAWQAFQYAQAAQPAGKVCVTTDQAGAIVAVTRQDSEGRILEIIAEAAQPSNALNWSELVALWESGAEQWEGLRDVVSRMAAHAHAIDTSPERVEKQAGDVQVPEPFGYVVEHNVPPTSIYKWSFHPAKEGLSFYKDTALVITPVYTAAPSTKEQSNG